MYTNINNILYHGLAGILACKGIMPTCVPLEQVLQAPHWLAAASTWLSKLFNVYLCLWLLF